MQKGDKFYEETDEVDERGRVVKLYYTLWELISLSPTKTKNSCEKWYIKYNNDDSLYVKWVDPVMKVL